VIYDIDVAVIGGGAAAVAAACEAAGNGAKVFLAAEEPYLGEDICATYRYWEKQNSPGHPLCGKLFGGGKGQLPFELKKKLDQELVEKNIPFLLCSYLSNVLFDSDGNVAGIVIANRSGEQVIRAKVVIDATPCGTALRLAGVPLVPRSDAAQYVDFVTVGGTAAPSLPHKTRKESISYEGKNYEVSTYRFEMPLKELTFPAIANAEQVVRDQTWNSGMIDSSDRLFFVPGEKFSGVSSYEGKDVPGPASMNMGYFRPRGKKGLFALNGCVDVPSKCAEALLTPSCMIQAGAVVGKAAAEEAKAAKVGKIVSGSEIKIKIVGGEAKIENSYIRPQHRLDSVKIDSEVIPVIASYDVVVVGGGTAGAPAAIAAAENGAKTLMIEQLHGLGGTTTLGAIGKYYHGYRQGYTAAIDSGVAGMGVREEKGKGQRKGGWNVQCKMEWFRRTARKAGADIWFGATVCGSVVDGKTVKGVVVATPMGKCVVLTARVIDATGSADVAIAAGAGYTYTNAEHAAIQGAGLHAVVPGKDYYNTDWAFISEFDVFDATRTYTVAKKKFTSAYDLGKLLQTRERRRVKGDFEVTAIDIVCGRTYPDTISYHRSNFDSHGFTVDPFFLLMSPHEKSLDASVPLSALLPKGLEGIMVTGLGISAQRDAMPLLRMQPCLQNQGYAVGLVAAMSIKADKELRVFDLKPIQEKLKAMEILPKSLKLDDNWNVDGAAVKGAVTALDMKMTVLPTILRCRDLSFPLLKERLADADQADQKLAAAFVLGMYGEKDGWKELLAEIGKNEKWDKGWNYRGMGQYGMSISPLDGLIIAGGRTGRKEFLPHIHMLAGQLDADSFFSHFRATACALETIRDSSSAGILAGVLKKPGIGGHAACTMKEALKELKDNITDNSSRNEELKELVLAKALYLCGDHEGLGEKTLNRYADGLCGHYARHAAAVLAMKQS